MRLNQSKGYERLIKRVFVQAYGGYDDDNPNNLEELVTMLAYWSFEKLPLLYDPDIEIWIQERAEEWLKHITESDVEELGATTRRSDVEALQKVTKKK